MSDKSKPIGGPQLADDEATTGPGTRITHAAEIAGRPKRRLRDSVKLVLDMRKLPPARSRLEGIAIPNEWIRTYDGLRLVYAAFLFPVFAVVLTVAAIPLVDHDGRYGIATICATGIAAISLLLFMMGIHQGKSAPNPYARTLALAAYLFGGLGAVLAIARLVVRNSIPGAVSLEIMGRGGDSLMHLKLADLLIGVALETTLPLMLLLALSYVRQVGRSINHGATVHGVDSLITVLFTLFIGGYSVLRLALVAPDRDLEWIIRWLVLLFGSGAVFVFIWMLILINGVCSALRGAKTARLADIT